MGQIINDSIYILLRGICFMEAKAIPFIAQSAGDFNRISDQYSSSSNHG